jgi:hypothetical protein
MTEKVIIRKGPCKSPALAGILSGLFPGTGALYNGEYLKGVLFIIIFAGLVTMQPHAGQPFPALLLAGFYIFQIIEAVQTAVAINRRAEAETEEVETPSKAGLALPAPSGSVFWGAVLIVLGAIFLLANFDIIDYGRIWEFWPVIVVVLGLRLIYGYFSKKNE